MTLSFASLKLYFIAKYLDSERTSAKNSTSENNTTPKRKKK